MSTVDELEMRIAKIEERNQIVEINKSWESSFTRRTIIALFTYLAISMYLYFIVHINPWVNAIVPSIGFLLSTLTLPFIKEMWIKHIYKK